MGSMKKGMNSGERTKNGIRSMIHRPALIAVMITVISCIMLAGCGKETKELDEYYEAMNGFANEVTAIKDNMESVDATSPNANATLLAYLDQMEEQFRLLSEMNVPKEFASNESLADEAYEYMQQAVTYYHEYYDDPECDKGIFDAATENYERAMKRVNYISYILKGEVPEGEGVNVIEDEGTDFEPVTEESADQ